MVRMTENHTLPLTHVLIFDGFDDLDAIGPLEILAAAGFPVHVVRPPSHPVAVHSAHGLTIDVVTSLSSDAELAVVPGGGWLDGSADGVRAQCARELPRRWRTFTAPALSWRRCAPGRCCWPPQG